MSLREPVDEAIYIEMYKGERFNSISHLVGVVLALAGASALLAAAIEQNDAIKIFAFSVYGFLMVSLYMVSTIYHSTKGKLKDFFRQLDYISIYLAIAAGYTPFTLVIMNNVWGWTLFTVIWVLAVIGIIQEIWLGKKTRKFSIFIYMLMGWLALIALKPFVEYLSIGGLLWLVAGGLSYTFGIVFFLLDEKYKHFHGYWHLCVLGGSVCHFICLYIYIA